MHGHVRSGGGDLFARYFSGLNGPGDRGRQPCAQPLTFRLHVRNGSCLDYIAGRSGEYKQVSLFFAICKQKLCCTEGLQVLRRTGTGFSRHFHPIDEKLVSELTTRGTWLRTKMFIVETLGSFVEKLNHHPISSIIRTFSHHFYFLQSFTGTPGLGRKNDLYQCIPELLHIRLRRKNDS